MIKELVGFLLNKHFKVYLNTCSKFILNTVKDDKCITFTCSHAHTGMHTHTCSTRMHKDAAHTMRTPYTHVHITCTHALHTCTHPIYVDMRTPLHTRTHAYVHTCVHTCTHTCMQAKQRIW